jgi:hypothetical protein
MTSSVPPIVADRVRRPTPANLFVLPGSLPVVSFGDPDRATVATLSLNPSWLEFQSKSGAWLLGRKRRLASMVSLGVDDPRSLDDAKVAQIVSESKAYFRGPNWYKGWFRWLESLLVNSGIGSYLDDSACHLDLVQWATKPAQRYLPAPAWDQLVEQDGDFLRWQFLNSNVSVVLLNGASVVRWVQRVGLVNSFDEDALPFRTNRGNDELRVFAATADRVSFVGWNRPLAGALAADGRQRLSLWLAEALQERLYSRTAPELELNRPGESGDSIR